jgi:hypothetical protein
LSCVDHMTVRDEVVFVPFGRSKPNNGGRSYVLDIVLFSIKAGVAFEYFAYV